MDGIIRQIIDNRTMIAALDGLFPYFVTSLTGLIFYLVWLFMQERWKKYWDASFLYHGIHMVEVLLMIPAAPFLYVLAHYNYKKRSISTFAFMGTSRTIRQFLLPIFVILLLGILVRAGLILSKQLQWRKIKRKAQDASPEAKRLLLECKKQCKVKRKVRIYEIPGLSTTYLDGMLFPRIWLPAGMEMEEYRPMILHELVHIKHHDLFWKGLTWVVQTIHWWNLPLQNLGQNAEKWEELYNDQITIGYLENPWQYCRLMKDQVIARAKAVDYGYNRNFVKQNSLVLQRVMRIKQQQENKRMRRERFIPWKILAACMAGGLLTATVTIPIARAEEKWMWETADINYIEPIIPQNPPIYRYSGDTFENYAWSVGEFDEQLDSLYTLDWTILPGAAMQTEYIYLTEGNTVTIVGGLIPNNIVVNIGLTRSNTEYDSTPVSGYVNMMLQVAETGYYRVFVANGSSQNVNFNGTIVVY